MIVKESDLVPFYNEKGVLANSGREKFLVKNKIIKLYDKGYPSLLVDAFGKTEYFEINKQIDYILAKKGYRKAGSMGIDVKALADDTNKMTESLVAPLEEPNDINPDEIPF